MHGDVSRTSPVGSDQEYTRRRFLKTAAWGAAAISAASMAGCASGEEKQGKAGEAKKKAQGAHQAVGGTSGSDARGAIMLSSNRLYDGFGQRGQPFVTNLTALDDPRTGGTRSSKGKMPGECRRTGEARWPGIYLRSGTDSE